MVWPPFDLSFGECCARNQHLAVRARFVLEIVPKNAADLLRSGCVLSRARHAGYFLADPELRWGNTLQQRGELRSWVSSSVQDPCCRCDGAIESSFDGAGEFER